MSKVKIAPSLLSADFSELAVEIQRVTEAGADWIHVDVMDGNFVPNLTLGMPIIKSIKPKCALPMDVHLMIERPERYVEQFVEAGADYLTIHVESTEFVEATLKNIRRLGCKAGITLRPNTELSTIEKYLPQVDLVLVMTVEPGFGGQSFMPAQVLKIVQLKKWRDEKKGQYLIEVDGGINTATAAICIQAGADILVAGNAVFKGEKSKANYQKNISEIRI